MIYIRFKWNEIKFVSKCTCSEENDWTDERPTVKYNLTSCMRVKHLKNAWKSISTRSSANQFIVNCKLISDRLAIVCLHLIYSLFWQWQVWNTHIIYLRITAIPEDWCTQIKAICSARKKHENFNKFRNLKHFKCSALTWSWNTCNLPVSPSE